MSDSKCTLRRGILLVLLAAVGLTTACGQMPWRVAGELQRPPVRSRVPIVLIPGISREVANVLRGGALVPISFLALRTDGEALAHLGDPHFPVDGTPAEEVPARIDRLLRGTEVRGLQALIDHLVHNVGYVRGNPDRPRDKDYPENDLAERQDATRAASLFVLYYDWRRDLSESACLLAERLAAIRTATGAPRVLVVAHSLGGIIARYTLRYGGRDVVRDRDCPAAGGPLASAVDARGAEGVHRLVLLGVPNRGSAVAFRVLLQDVSLFGLVGLGLREAVFTMPIAWQLLPHAEADGRVPILVGDNGEERISLYSLQTWLQRGWVPEGARNPERVRFVEIMLARALALEQSMDDRHPAEEAVPRLVVGSECRPTPARALDTGNGVHFLAFGLPFQPLSARLTAPGDGVVTSASALGLLNSSTLTAFATCARHNTYLDNPDVVTRVVQYLLQ